MSKPGTDKKYANLRAFTIKDTDSDDIMELIQITKPYVVVYCQKCPNNDICRPEYRQECESLMNLEYENVYDDRYPVNQRVKGGFK